MALVPCLEIFRQVRSICNVCRTSWNGDRRSSIVLPSWCDQQNSSHGQHYRWRHRRTSGQRFSRWNGQVWTQGGEERCLVFHHLYTAMIAMLIALHWLYGPDLMNIMKKGLTRNLQLKLSLTLNKSKKRSWITSGES